MFRALLLLGLLAASWRPCLATKCGGRPSVCQAFASSDAVFIGRLVARSHNYSLMERDPKKDMERIFPGRTADEIAADESAETLTKLRSYYLSLFPGALGKKLAEARSGKELAAALNEVLDEPVKMSFQVLTAYKGVAGAAKTVDVWMEIPAGLGAPPLGDTYLVYADRGDSGRLEIMRCSRGLKRVTEAPEDLAYLYFVDHGGSGSGRLYGFVTTDKADQTMRLYYDEVSAPLSGVMVVVHAGSHQLFAGTDKEGRFIFDGLPPGEYEVNAYVIGEQWPLEGTKQLVGTRRVKLGMRACERILFQIDAPKEEK